MSYPLDPVALAILTDDEWSALLLSVWNAPLPRTIVRLLPEPEPAKQRVTAPAGRRALALERVAKGEKKADIAKALGVSPSMLSKILKGERN